MLRNEAFRHNDKRCPAAGVSLLHPLGNLLNTDLLLGNQDGVGSGGHAGMQCDPSDVPSHYLGNHAAVMGFAGGPEAIDGLGRDVDGRVEAEAVVRSVEVVIHGLGHAHNFEPGISEALGGGKGAFAADCDDRVNPQTIQVVLDDIRAATILKRVGARGAQDSTALLGDTAHHGARYIHDVTLDNPAPTVAESDEFMAFDGDALQNRAADDGVQSRAISATGKDPNFHASARFVRPGSEGQEPTAASTDMASSTTFAAGNDGRFTPAISSITRTTWQL